MKKINEARENEKKQDRADQQNHYQEALPAITPLSLLTFNEEAEKLTFPIVPAPNTIHRSYGILLPPKVVC